jgi:hypothetical protein
MRKFIPLVLLLLATAVITFVYQGKQAPQPTEVEVRPEQIKAVH